MKIFIQIVLVSLVLTTILTVVIWSDGHDKKIMEAADKYEKCVQAEYGVSPAYWYAEHGEYPTCQTTAQ